jgi:hypothetical protein
MIWIIVIAVLIGIIFWGWKKSKKQILNLTDEENAAIIVERYLETAVKESSTAFSKISLLQDDKYTIEQAFKTVLSNGIQIAHYSAEDLELFYSSIDKYLDDDLAKQIGGIYKSKDRTHFSKAEMEIYNRVINDFSDSVLKRLSQVEKWR